MDCSVSPLGLSVQQERNFGSVSQKKKWFPTSTPIQGKLNDSGFSSGERFTSIKRRYDFLEEIEEDVLLNESLSFLSPNKHWLENASYTDKKKDSSKLQDVSNIDNFCHFSLEDEDLFLYSNVSYELNNTKIIKNTSREFLVNKHTSDSFYTSSFLIESSEKDFSHQNKKLFLSSNLLPYTPKHVDFVKELKKQNCFPVLSLMFSYLTSQELHICTYVSHDWKEAIKSDISSRKRKASYIKEKHSTSIGPNKENSINSSKKSCGFTHIGSLKDIQNITCDKNKVSMTNSHIENVSLLQVTAKDSKVKLVKCPMCSSASKINNGQRSICSRKLCKYEFCSNCYSPFEKFHTCSLITNEDMTCRNLVLCSKKNKKNLRRL